MYDRSVSEEIKYEQQKGSSVEELPFLFIKQKPPAMPVDKRKTTQALAVERSRYTKKLLCAKLNVRLATVHK